MKSLGTVLIALGIIGVLLELLIPELVISGCIKEGKTFMPFAMYLVVVLIGVRLRIKTSA